MFFSMPLTSLNTEVLAYLLISIDFESDFFPVCSFLVPEIPPQDFKASFFYDSSTFKVRSYKEVFFSLIPLNKN